MALSKIEWYEQFVDFSYTPRKDDLIALFYFEPASGISVKECMGRIASESSTGTWTTLFKMPARMRNLMAIAFERHGNYVKVAYPRELWEDGNMPNLLSGVAGNIFGMKAVKNLRLIDIQFPQNYIKTFRGPKFGMEGIRKFMKIKDRPLTGAVPKPKIGFTDKEHAEIGFETWMGGFDFVKDDENLASLKFNNFYKRTQLLAKLREKAEKETGEKKDAFINVTADVDEMKKRVDYLADHGWRYCMIDVVVTGPAAVHTIAEYASDRNLAIHAHRAMHAMFDRNPKHGMSMQFLAKMNRMLGVSQIHTGTAVGKLHGDKQELLACADVLREEVTPERKNMTFKQKWYGMKNCFPVASGGMHPGLIPAVMDIYGTRLAMLVSGGIHGHPKGTRIGAKASMQAIEAWMENESLEEKAKRHPELREALEKWGHFKPR